MCACRQMESWLAGHSWDRGEVYEEERMDDCGSGWMDERM